MTAMFPLGSVLLPGALLPLHVFEPRYGRLVRDCLAGSRHEFGVVLIERGHEVGGGDVRNPVGTMAQIAQIAELAAGRFALITVGTRRIRVKDWFPDDPYPLAEVEDWPDDPAGATAPELSARIAGMTARVRRTNALAVELGDVSADLAAEISEEPLLASYQLSTLAPIGPADRQRLLEAAGPADRIGMLGAVLDDVEAMLRFRLAHPSNGDGGDRFGPTGFADS